MADMDADKLARIGTAVLGGAFMFSGIFQGASAALDPEAEISFLLFAVVQGLAPGVVLVICARVRDTDKLVRIGAAVLGVGILSVSIAYGAIVAVEGLAAEQAYRLLAAAPGLAAGSVLVVGARTGRTADRGFAGSCIILAGAALLAGDIMSNVARGLFEIGFTNLYAALTLGPVGVAIGAPLLAIGIRVFLQERLFGLCMMVPGAGFLGYIVNSVIDPLLRPRFADIAKGRFEEILESHRLFDEITRAYSPLSILVVGSAMVAVGLAAVWQARRMRQNCAP